MHRSAVKASAPSGARRPRMQTNGVNTNGAAANVMNVDRSGKKVRPGTFGEYKSRLTGTSKKSKSNTFAVTPLVLTHLSLSEGPSKPSSLGCGSGSQTSLQGLASPPSLRVADSAAAPCWATRARPGPIQY